MPQRKLAELLGQETTARIDLKIMQATVAQEQIATGAIHQLSSFDSRAYRANISRHLLAIRVCLEINKHTRSRVVATLYPRRTDLFLQSRVAGLLGDPVKNGPVRLFQLLLRVD